MHVGQSIGDSRGTTVGEISQNSTGTLIQANGADFEVQTNGSTTKVKYKNNYGLYSNGGFYLSNFTAGNDEFINSNNDDIDFYKEKARSNVK